VISDKASELNISLVLEVRGDSVKCTDSSHQARWRLGRGAMESNPQSNDSHRKGNQWDERGSSLCVSHASCLGKGRLKTGTTRREEGRADSTTADSRNTWIFKASSEFSDVRSAVRTLRDIPGSSSSTRNRSNWETGCIVGVRSAGRDHRTGGGIRAASDSTGTERTTAVHPEQ